MCMGGAGGRETRRTKGTPDSTVVVTSTEERSRSVGTSRGRGVTEVSEYEDVPFTQCGPSRRYRTLSGHGEASGSRLLGTSGPKGAPKLPPSHLYTPEDIRKRDGTCHYILGNGVGVRREYEEIVSPGGLRDCRVTRRGTLRRRTTGPGGFTGHEGSVPFDEGEVPDRRPHLHLSRW